MKNTPDSSAPNEPSRKSLIHAGALAATIGIFIVDLQQPLVYAVGILYVLVILLGLWSTWRPYPIVAAVVATTLLIIDAIVGWDAEAPSFVFVNRPLMVLVFTAAATLVMRE